MHPRAWILKHHLAASGGSKKSGPIFGRSRRTTTRLPGWNGCSWLFSEFWSSKKSWEQGKITKVLGVFVSVFVDHQRNKQPKIFLEMRIFKVSTICFFKRIFRPKPTQLHKSSNFANASPFLASPQLHELYQSRRIPHSNWGPPQSTWDATFPKVWPTARGVARESENVLRPDKHSRHWKIHEVKLRNWKISRKSTTKRCKVRPPLRCQHVEHIAQHPSPGGVLHQPMAS